MDSPLSRDTSQNLGFWRFVFLAEKLVESIVRFRQMRFLFLSPRPFLFPEKNARRGCRANQGPLLYPKQAISRGNQEWDIENDVTHAMCTIDLHHARTNLHLSSRTLSVRQEKDESIKPVSKRMNRKRLGCTSRAHSPAGAVVDAASAQWNKICESRATLRSI